MTLLEIAQFLDEHPDFSPVFAMNVRGNFFVDGFTAPYHGEENYLSMRDVEQMLAAKPHEI